MDQCEDREEGVPPSKTTFLGLSGCNLSEKSYEALSSALGSQSSTVTFLDLSKNNLQDFELKNLSTGLKSPHCKLKTLRLSDCKLSERSCEALSSVLRSKYCRLREIDLSNNNLHDLGVLFLSVGLQSSHCTLETLRLSDCNLSEKTCAALSAVLSSQTCTLRELDLNDNDLMDSGIRFLCVGAMTTHCKLETLRLSGCNLSQRSCETLSSVLSSQSSSLRELDLSNNNLQDSGITFLSDVVKNPQCKLESLRLSHCNLSERSHEILFSVLSSQSSSLRKLDLSNNILQDSGVELVTAGLKSSQCTVETPSFYRFSNISKWWRPADATPWQVDDGKAGGAETRGGELNFSLEPARYKSDLWKDFCQLTIDTNTVNTKLKLSDNNRKVTCVEEVQSYPDHPDRFDEPQLLCTDVLTSSCYWEVEWSGVVDISVSYRRIRRKGTSNDCVFGYNDKSWSLRCSDGGPLSVRHNKKNESIDSSSSVFKRAAVYVNYPAGTLSFYRVSTDDLIHLHTFNTTFTEPLYAGFTVGPGSSVTLCVD